MGETSALYLTKAARALTAAQRLFASGDHDFAASRAYYVMLYAADALLQQRGLHFVEHARVHEAINDEYVRTGVFAKRFHDQLVAAFDTRLIADYQVEPPFPAGEAVRLLDEAAAFLAMAERVLTAQ